MRKPSTGILWLLAGAAALPLYGAVAPPSITKAFGAAHIPVGGSTTLTFTISNSNAASTLSGVGFTDPLPAGLVVSTPNGITGSCGGGTILAVAGSASVSLAGGTLALLTSCTFAVNVTGVAAGVENNVTSAVTSVEGGSGNTASASISVGLLAPQTITKVFGVAALTVGQTTSLSFTIANSNAVQLTAVGFTDPLPAGLVVSTPNGLTGLCGGGTITAVAGSHAVSLSGATLAGNNNCTFSVNVSGTVAGTQHNVTGSVSSLEAGTGGTASADISVINATPTLSEWGMALFAIILMAAAGLQLRRSNPSRGFGA